MKSTIIFLGLFALSFNTAKAANEFKAQDLEQQELTVFNLENSNQEVTNDNCEVAGATDTTIFNPASVVKTTYVKTIEDIITENRLITESKEEAVLPLSVETTVEDRIAEDCQIIESKVSNEFLPLDFKKINSKKQTIKVYNNNAMITVDLKL